MKRVLFLAVIVLLLSGCAPSLADPIAPDDGLNGMAEGNKNVLVEEPTKGQPTFEIDERLVGKYVALEDVRRKFDLEASGVGYTEYFEIKSDGTAEISLHTAEGPVCYGPEQIEILAYYAKDKVYLHFNLIDGSAIYPDHYGLSLPLVADSSLMSFLSIDYAFSERRLKFIKQSCSDALVVENRNVVVKEPPMNQATFEIDERLVGKHIALEDYNGKRILAENSQEYFEIRPDGTAALSLRTFAGEAYYGPEILEITAYYSDTGRVILQFNLIQGYWTYPASCGLSISFEGDSDFTSFTSTSYLPSYELKFIKTS